VSIDDLGPWRERYRAEMNCQIIHDSIHRRRGWSREYLVAADGVDVGYGSIALAGPWAGKPTLYEFYVAPEHRVRSFEIFESLIDESRPVAIVGQSNAPLAATMLCTFARQLRADAILFEDKAVTAHAPVGATFRRARPGDIADINDDQLQWHGVVELEGQVAATGGILFHYNPPYGDIYMEVGEAFRRRGLGSFLVQELKRICYEGGFVPGARCGVANHASRRTLQKAGFVPCGNILAGNL
jgi:GNAT superfamily N-acetyltransferase